MELAAHIRHLFHFQSEDLSSDSLIASGRNLHLPPAVFKSWLRIEYESGTVLEINARDALVAWASQHSEEELPNLTVLKVPSSKQWLQSKRLDSINPEAENMGSRTLLPNEWDWTYSSDYVCSIGPLAANTDALRQDSLRVIQLKDLRRDPSPDTIWRAYEGPSKIDTEMLSRKEDILFFDDIILYQVIFEITMPSQLNQIEF